MRGHDQWHKGRERDAPAMSNHQTERVPLRMLLQLYHVVPFFVVLLVFLFYCLFILIDKWYTLFDALFDAPKGLGANARWKLNGVKQRQVIWEASVK